MLKCNIHIERHHSYNHTSYTLSQCTQYTLLTCRHKYITVCDCGSQFSIINDLRVSRVCSLFIIITINHTCKFIVYQSWPSYSGSSRIYPFLVTHNALLYNKVKWIHILIHITTYYYTSETIYSSVQTNNTICTSYIVQ